MRLICIAVLLLLTNAALHAQRSSVRPKIGLALSGGGAKGMAHIGILKAIDAAGLKIDYITGTSMGSIVGGLYALGYSGDSIEKIARNMDWEVLLSNRTSLRALIMEEKGEYGKYALELPLENGGFRLPTGILEGQEMWLKLSELFAPAYNITHFDDLSIPFRCIATEVSSGNALVLEQGKLATAIRASMAIPSVFTAVNVDGCTLVDGGIVRNFPVKDALAMGADFVIGSSVSSGLLPQEKLTDAAQILMQVIFLEDGLHHREQADLCNIYIEHPMENYSAASFAKAKEIIDLGIEQGKLLYPRLKHLADSLDALYGKQTLSETRLPKSDSVFISAYAVRGLSRTDEEYFTKMMGFKTGRYYDVTRLASRVRNVFGTRYYQRILYTLEPLPDGSSKVIFDVQENAPTQAKIGLHYNTFSGISLIANLTKRNLFMSASRSLVTVALSENFRVRGEHQQHFGAKNRLVWRGNVQFETFGFTNYKNFRSEGLQRQGFFKSEARFQYSTDRKITTGAGWRYERIQYAPKIRSQFDLTGNNQMQTVFGYLAFNTLDAGVSPHRGLKMEVEVSCLFQQNPRLSASSNGEPLPNLDTLGTLGARFPYFTFSAEWYKPLARRFTFLVQTQWGVNFDYNQNILNDFAIGGLVRQYRNQITFVGLPETSVYTPSVAALQLGLRYEPFFNLFLILRTNGAMHNFVSKREMNMKAPDFLSGHALTLAYNTPIGPLELSAMYSDQSKKVGTYINFGLAF